MGFTEHFILYRKCIDQRNKRHVLVKYHRILVLDVISKIQCVGVPKSLYKYNISTCQ